MLMPSYKPTDFQFGLPGSGKMPPMAGSNGSIFQPSIGTAGVTSQIGAPKMPGLGLNFETANLALSGLGTIANIWAAFQAQKLAKQQFNFTKDFANTNLANQVQSYNTTLADRARSRGFTEGQAPGVTAAYISQNSLPKKTI